MNKPTFIAYIDEAGDEGFGKLKASPGASGQSAWLILGACIVRSENDIFLPKWRDEILSSFNGSKAKDLHFRNLKHDQKVVACQILSGKKIGICLVASNKITIADHPKREIFKKPQHLYNYLVRFLLERITNACAYAAKKSKIDSCSIKIVFSRRGGTNYQVMKDYLALIRDGKEKIYSNYKIDWSILDIDSIEVENHSKRAGLQIADVVTSAMFCAIEPNAYGNFEPRYANLLQGKYIKSKGKILNFGVTLIPPLGKNPICNERRNFLLQLK
ncbi:DUF3800 domain-containing protein [Asticcacaulis sp. YBE204]|uniref:DUF3800 domain-containing protein n=1 Tax=Asticcacaulis sp. YBE204 TaxID=1282363 RepID=UPI00138AAEBB|nr:DUF3800 domain-containing protein [Asticcacaulis sp. YBE204]